MASLALMRSLFTRGDLVRLDTGRGLPWRFRERYQDLPAIVLSCADNAVRVAFPTGEVKASLAINWVLINPVEGKIKNENN